MAQALERFIKVMSSGFSEKRTAINIASQWGAQLANIVITLVLITYAVGLLGAEHYGGWAAIVSIIGYLTMLDAGMSVTVQYYISRFTTAGDIEKLSIFYSSAYVVYGVAGILALLICLAISYDSALLFSAVPPAAAEENVLALRWVGAGMCLFMLSMPAQGALMGMQRHTIKNTIEIFSLLVRLLVVVALFECVEPSLEYLGFGFFAASLVRLLLCYVSIKVTSPTMTVCLSSVTREAFREVFTFGGHATFWSVSTAIVRESGPLLALVLLGAKESTYIYVGTRLVRSIGLFVQSAGQVFMPIATSLSEASDTDRMKQLLLYGTKYCALLGLAGAVVLLVFGKHIMLQWLGEPGVAAYGVVIVTTMGTVGVWINRVSLSIIMGTRVLWPLSFMMLFHMIFCVGLALLLSQYCGVTGLAAGLVIPVALTSLFYVPILAIKQVEVDPAAMLSNLVVPLLVSAIVAFTGILLVSIWVPDTLLVLIMELIIVFVIFAVTTICIGVERNMRSLILCRISGALGCKKNCIKDLG